MKELLIKLRDFIEKDEKFYGMCYSIDLMFQKGYISSFDKSDLKTFLMDNRGDSPLLGYWWPRGERKPRIDWLNVRIKVFEAEEKVEVSVKALKEIYEAHDYRIKDILKKELPEIFPPLKNGQWYIINEKHLLCYNNGGESYGFWLGSWGNDWVFPKRYPDQRPATNKEVEKALTEEAKRRGLWKVPIIDARTKERCTEEKFIIYYDNEYKDLWSSYGIVFSNGKWAEPVEQPKLMSQKDIEEALGYKIEIVT